MSDTPPYSPGRMRPRRLRKNQVVRDLVAETHISPSQFIVPHFVLGAENVEKAIPSMPGISELGIKNLVKKVGADLKLGIRSVLLFGHPDDAAHKTPDGKAAWDKKGAVQRAVSQLKREFGNDLLVMTDVCPVSYTHLTLPTTPYV